MRVHSSTFISNTAPRSHFSSNVVQAVKKLTAYIMMKAKSIFYIKITNHQIEFIIEKQNKYFENIANMNISTIFH